MASRRKNRSWRWQLGKLISLEGTIDSSYAFPGGTVADVAWHHKGSLLGVSGYGGIFIYNLLDPSENPSI